MLYWLRSAALSGVPVAGRIGQALKAGDNVKTAPVQVQGKFVPVMKAEVPLKGNISAAAAKNPAQARLLHNQLVAEQIANGHAFDKHVLHQGEFPGWIRTRRQLQTHVETVLNDPRTKVYHQESDVYGAAYQELRYRVVYAHEPTGTVIIENTINAADRGSVFQPTEGVAAYIRQKNLQLIDNFDAFKIARKENRLIEKLKD